MPVRKIPRNYRGVTGQAVGRKSRDDAEFESLLEADHLLLLDFDPAVAEYTVQPLSIKVPRRTNPYRPDALVHFVKVGSRSARRSELIEVKPKDILEREKDTLLPSFRAARQFCKDRGWTFRVKTEDHIRTPELDLVKQLRNYYREPCPEDGAQLILATIRRLGTQATFASVLTQVAGEENSRERLDASRRLLTLIAHRRIVPSEAAPIVGHSILRLPRVG